MNSISLKSILYQLVLVSLSLLIILTFPIFIVFIVLPFYILRICVSYYARYFRKDLQNMIETHSSLFSVDDMHGTPQCNVVIWFVLKGNVSLEKFRQRFCETVLNLKKENGDYIYPELRQHYQKGVLGYMFWKCEKNFSVEKHIRFCDYIEQHSKSIVNEKVMLKLNERLLSSPWPKNMSPWEFLLVHNYQMSEDLNDDGCLTEANTLVLFHLHHGLGDGYSFLKIICQRLAGLSATEGQIALPKHSKSLWTNTLDNIVLPFRIAYDYSRQILEDSYDFSYWHFEEKDLSRQLRVGSLRKIPLSFVKGIKNLHGVSLTAILLAATAGGMRKYMLLKGIKIPKVVKVFIPWPYPNHPNSKLTNHVTGCIGHVPVGESNARKRVILCQQRLNHLRDTTGAFVNFHTATLSGGLPTSCKWAMKNYFSSGIWSNFPGTQDTIIILGYDVLDFSYNVANLLGRTGFTFTVLSYGEYLSIDLTIDKNLVPEEGSVEQIMENIREEFSILYNENQT